MADKGRIAYTSEVECATCTVYVCGLVYPQRKAAVQLRRMGWTTVLGRWTCPKCSTGKKHRIKRERAE